LNRKLILAKNTIPCRSTSHFYAHFTLHDSYTCEYFIFGTPPSGEYNKLAAPKIGPLEIVKKFNANTYQLKLPSHIKTANIFNVKHLVPFFDDSSAEDANSRVNSLQHGEDDVDRNAWEYMRKNGRDMEVEPPQRMMTRS
jgi:hypothetical protein